MQRHTSAKPNGTARERVEEALCRRSAAIKPFEPLVDRAIVDRFKDGTYGLSTLGFALYANGYKPESKSELAPFGLLYHDGEAIFSIGYFRREDEPADKPGYLMIIAPRGKDVLEKVNELVQGLITSDLPVSGVYTRFLRLEQYVQLLGQGYKPAKEHPWHPNAPEEDENLQNGRIYLPDLIEMERSVAVGPVEQRIKELLGGSKNHRRNFRMQIDRFRNFRERNKLDYHLRNALGGDRHTLAIRQWDDAGRIIEAHFRMLQKSGKQIGSVPEDYFGCLDIVREHFDIGDAWIGYLSGVPVSLFIGEDIGAESYALYATITLRDPNYVFLQLLQGNSGAWNGEEICIDPESPALKGFSAITQYAYAQLLATRDWGTTKILHLGGSEHPDLNEGKRRMGAQNDPTYWVVKVKEG